MELWVLQIEVLEHVIVGDAESDSLGHGRYYFPSASLAFKSGSF